MRLKIAAMTVALCFVMIAVVPAMGAADADASGDYVSQLDANGLAVYETVTESFAEAMSDPENEMSFEMELPFPVLFDSTEEAEAYAEETVNSALAAIYYTDALAVWLWDLPVTEVSVETSTAVVTLSQSGTQYRQGYFVAVKVAFTLTVPEDMMDDPDTEENELLGYLQEVEEAMAFEASGDDTASKVRSIANHLYGITVEDDEDGAVSNVYDALVTGTSSSAGIAAAFNLLCQYNGIESMTVRGTVYTDPDDEGSAGYWNAVLDDGVWYLCDVSWYDGSDRSVLMAGSNTELESTAAGERFGGTHVADLDLASGNGLQPVAVSVAGYDWPDESTFLDRYGTSIVAAIMVAMILGVFVYAIKKGNV